MRHSARVLAAALALALLPAPGTASVLPALDLDALVRGSDDVFVGTVTHEWSEWTGERIVTHHLVHVERALVPGGGRSGELVVVTTLGGEIGEIGLWVPGEARLAVGDRRLMFTSSSRFGRVLTGMAQGSAPVLEDADGTEWVLPPRCAGLMLTPASGPGQPGRPWITEPSTLEAVARAVEVVMDRETP